MLRRSVALTAVVLVLATATLRADVLDDLKKAFKGQAVEVEITNTTKKPIYVWVDDTGRHNDKVKTDTVNGADKKPLPPGLVVDPGATRSFGECVGIGDKPTLHVIPMADKTTAAAEGKSDKAVGPDDYGKKMIELKRPVIRLTVGEDGVKLMD